MSTQRNTPPRPVAPFLIVVGVVGLLLAMGVGQIQFTTAAPSTNAVVASSTGVVAAGVPSVSVGSAATSCTLSPVPLGSAANFRVLAATTVTNTGATVIHGNLGVSPGTAVTGFPPGNVTGTMHIADTTAATAQTDLGIAFKNATARTNCPISIAGNIGGKTLSPGLYVSTSSLAISSGDLTLTAKGHSTAVFIFQIATKFTITSGRAIILAGGALAANIYWVVGSSATLGTTSVVYGNILAHKSISLATGATLHGRALAQIGAVTLAGNPVSHRPNASVAAGIVPSASAVIARSFA
jgi:hypothetical protein